ncbi:MAG: hypothetical protein RL757_386, partial [Bacteroidota bacterium]
MMMKTLIFAALTCASVGAGISFWKNK